jgi:hypothetical protein
MSIKELVNKFGGQTALAAMIGKGQPTVSYWVKEDRVPTKWQPILLELAKTKGIDLSPEDFMQGMISNDADINLSNISIVADNSNSELSNIFSDEKKIFLLEPLVNNVESISHFLFYASHDGTVKVQVILGDETVWASQKGMAEIFGVDVRTVNEHLQNVFKSGEIDINSVIRKSRITAADGKSYDTNFYNLDAIISIGYRVNSYQATQFRKWATGILKEYLIKGFTLDDDRLKQGNQLFGKDYFDELLDRVRAIRASERRFYQKITDIYSQCSIDYDKDAPITQQFYAHVQDKLHYAIHGHTSAELIKLRANASKPLMGLSTYKNAEKGGLITKSDVTVGKNYLNETELDELNRLVSQYLDFAEGFARRHIPMKMKDWAEKLDGFLTFNAYEVLNNFGNIKRDVAEKIALSEYEKFRAIQDKEYKSDFDKVVDKVRVGKQRPKSND